MMGQRNYDKGPSRGQPLTDRETEVMKLQCDGLTQKEIAAKLGVSVKTINKHVCAIHIKWGTDSQVKMLRYAVRRGIYDLRVWEGNPT
jgi:two-component system response regulator NreC